MADPKHISFTDTETAFKHKSMASLRKARLLFRSFGFPILLKWGPGLAKIAVGLGMKSVIKNTIFAQFCGGETIAESAKAIENLAESHVGTILDYSVEGEENEAEFEHTCSEILKTIEIASGDKRIPFSVFKTTGIIQQDLLEKVTSKVELTGTDKTNWEHGVERFHRICKAAFDKNVRIFVDAEESWIQGAIDQLTEEMMEKYNQKSAIVYNTIQLYRHDRLAYLKEHVAKSSCFLGYKLVRGAYMEKERARAMEKGYEDPIQKDKATCDADYDAAVLYCLDHIDRVSICAGTHNEQSSEFLAEAMNTTGIAADDLRIFFSQLLGMSDHISFNLAANGYNVAKYVPYGPVSAVIPYLTRRARENTGVKGQMGRELALIEAEMRRRKA